MSQAIEVENEHQEGDQEVQLQDQPGGKRRRKSPVWKDFEELESDDPSMTKAKCKICKKILTAQSENGTSHLKRHIEIHDKGQASLDQYVLRAESNPDGSVALKNHKFDPDLIRRAIAVFLAGGEHPFTFVEEVGFRYLLNCCVPQFKKVGRFTVKRDIMAMYGTEKIVLKKVLSDAPGRICFTSDNWKSETSKDSYICITAHFIDADWKLQKRIILFSELLPPYDGVSIADTVAACFSNWNVESKVMSITLDNASYNDNMSNSLRMRLLAHGRLLCDGAFFQVRCCAHILNLIVQAGLKLIDTAVDKIHQGVQYIHGSSIRRHKFYADAQSIFHLDTKKKLCLDMPVRWNSTFRMLENALFYKGVLKHYASRDATFLANFDLSDTEWKKVAVMTNFLKSFHEVTCTFSGTKYPTANLYFKGVFKIHSQLLQAAKEPQNFMSPMVTEMKIKFDKYWSDYSLILSCAAVLDPRYKLNLIKYCYKKIHVDESTAEEQVNKVVAKLYELFDEYKVLNPTASNTNPSNNVEQNRQDDLFDDYAEYLTTVAPQTQKSQLDLYLQKSTRDPKVDLDVLEFWKASSVSYPDLANMARDLLTIPVSSVASESAFSIGKKVITPSRSSLNPETVEALVCLQDWMRSKKDIATEATELDDSDEVMDVD